MFTLKKTFNFEAGHQLYHHEGKCAHPHGHSYKLEVFLKGPELQTSGSGKNMLYDFAEVARHVRPLIKDFLDHKWLNDTLETDSPTAEFIAHWIFQKLKDHLPHLYSVQIWETETCMAAYSLN